MAIVEYGSRRSSLNTDQGDHRRIRIKAIIVEYGSRRSLNTDQGDHQKICCTLATTLAWVPPFTIFHFSCQYGVGHCVMRVDPGFRGMDGVWLGSREWMGFGWDLGEWMGCGYDLLCLVALDLRFGSLLGLNLLPRMVDCFDLI